MAEFGYLDVDTFRRMVRRLREAEHAPVRMDQQPVGARPHWWFLSQWAVLDEALAESASATASIWAGDPLADTGDNVEVWGSPIVETLPTGIKVPIGTFSGRWMVLGPTVLWGKLDEALTYNGTATCSIWTGTTLADSGSNLEVANWLLASGSLATGSKVKIEWIAGKWYVTGAPC